MTVGVSATNLAHPWLNVIRGTTFTGLAGFFVKLHIGDPGNAGTANPAVGSTTRPAITYSAPSAGAMAMTGTAPSWTNGGTSETLSHLSFWDNATAGTFYASCALGSPQAWASSNTFTLSTQTWTITPIAA